MNTRIVSLTAAVVALGLAIPALAADMRDRVKVEVEGVGLHPGMEPGMYVCAAGHLHIRGTVHNTSLVTLGRIKVAGKAFGAEGRLLGEATASTKQVSLAPGDKAQIDLEFLTVSGPLVQQVKKHEIKVIEAPTKRP